MELYNQTTKLSIFEVVYFIFYQALTLARVRRRDITDVQIKNHAAVAPSAPAAVETVEKPFLKFRFSSEKHFLKTF
jgi:hypothetical protein